MTTYSAMNFRIALGLELLNLVIEGRVALFVGAKPDASTRPADRSRSEVIGFLKPRQ